MNIRVEINKYEKDNLKGFVTLILDECLVIKDLKIMESKGGNLFVSFPNKKVKEEYKDIVYPITKEFREEIMNRIFEEYNKKEKQEEFEITSDDDLPF